MTTVEQKVGHVHDELMAFRAESAGNFAEVNGRLDRVHERFTEVNGRLDLLAGEVNSRLDRMEDTMAQILARLPEQRT